MIHAAFIELLELLIILFALAYPLGLLIARLVQGDSRSLNLFWPLENALYRITGIDPDHEMDWKEYALHLMIFSVTGAIALYALLRVQGSHPLNPQHRPDVPSDLAFNIAMSFVTNTNWQSYVGETTLSYLTQMLGLTVQNFLSAASGMAVLFALVRGFTRLNTSRIGNFWVDLTRANLYVLLPLAIVLSVLLISQGVVQSLTPDQPLKTLECFHSTVGRSDGYRDCPEGCLNAQIIPLGPVASQIAIKQLGTNGGGYFHANSAHPFENPTPLSNFLELLSILLLPAALCFTFGSLVGDLRQGMVIVGSMTLVFGGLALVEIWTEQRGNPALSQLGLDARANLSQSGGNMEGKETRFGIIASALWAIATTAGSNGSVNSMLDSFTPIGGLLPMGLMQVGEVIFGGVGSGLYSMLVFAMIAVFIAGLMIGRTPEYLGKKIEAFEMKMAALVILIPAILILMGTAVSVMVEPGRSAVGNPGPHGFSEILYAFSSAASNNGSAFAGITSLTPYYNLVLGVTMFIARLGGAIPVLAIAGHLALKKTSPAGAGTLSTDNGLFLVLLIAIVLITGALTFIPALVLGPVVEHLLLFRETHSSS